MDRTAQILTTANSLITRGNATTSTNPTDQTRPGIYKAVGIILAVASGIFIGVSFVLKKIGLMKANEKYDQAAGEGYGYLKNAFWWTGMTLMIMGEICNFVAYAFVDAILVTPLGALSVVITTILSAIFLKERLSMVGKVGCFLCIIGSVVIVMNAPSESSAANIQEMQQFVIAPGFLSYAGVIILGCGYIAVWVAPRYGKKSMMVYLSICSLIGGLSVVATQGLGAAIVAQIGGTPQFNQWFLYVIFVFVVSTLVTEIIYLNKALNLFNAALVTPTYYVYFTSSTIITSAILFRGFKGSVTSIITVVMGFFVICAGVVLLQLSKSAKDVPDTAVFTGDLDQVRTIAEQEQPETEPKADAIRGAAAIVRRLSSARQKWELEEAKRLYEEKQQDLEAIGESDNVHIQWDGLRRRRTTLRVNGGARTRYRTLTSPDATGPLTQHPPLGMSYYPVDSDSDNHGDSSEISDRKSSFFNSIMGNRKSMHSRDGTQTNLQSRTRLIPLTTIPTSKSPEKDDSESPSLGPEAIVDHVFGLPSSLQAKRKSTSEIQGVEKQHPVDLECNVESEIKPASPSHSARSNFSFQDIFSKAQESGQLESADQITVPSPVVTRAPFIRQETNSTFNVASEEAALGLVKLNSNSIEGNISTPFYIDDGVLDKSQFEVIYDKGKRPGSNEGQDGKPKPEETPEEVIYDLQRKKWNASRRSGAKSVILNLDHPPNKEDES
ncbi:hypothetical protein K3495_g13265 [Podosphaera aphanis]|nr:hypothetical protein K3495_g13265 [Podosphaera aphanis]